MRDRELVGRERERNDIDRLLVGVERQGGALVVSGEPGIGKSALLRMAGITAHERGMAVVSTSGVRSETNLPFAGLHQLMRPWLGQLDALAPVQGGAIRAAFGMLAAARPEPFMIALATLDLLGGAAASRPLLVVIEDAHWLDRPTADVLTFVGRRLLADPIIMLAATRDGYPSPLLEAGLPLLRLTGLSRQEARALVMDRFPGLAATVRDRVLNAAQGNPLALLELPDTVVHTSGHTGAPISGVTLTVRLEAAFASRSADLPDRTRTLLRIAAADERTDVAEILAAGEIALREHTTVDDLNPAIEAQLVELDLTGLRFRHPLVSSAIYQAATLADRIAAHKALATVLDDPDRQVWHHAAATMGRDRSIALELQEMARRAKHRGATTAAVAAFERAAGLTPDPSERARVVLHAAEAASELGDTDIVLRLLRQVQSSDLGSRERAILLWLEDSVWPGLAGDPARIAALTQAADAHAREGDIDLALNLLTAAAFRSFVGNVRGAQIRRILDVADHLEVAPDDPRLLHVLGYAAPHERGADIIGRLHDPAPTTDPVALCLLGAAASQAGAVDRAATLLDTAATELRGQGRMRALAEVLLHQAWTATLIADYTTAVPAAYEAARLAEETRQPALQTGALAAQATLAALRGENDLVDELTGVVERNGLASGAAIVLALAQYARGLAALGQGRHQESYEQLLRLYQPEDPACHQQIGANVIGDFAEAAVHSGHHAEAQEIIEKLEPLLALTPQSRFHAMMRHARALIATEADAEDLFLGALTAENAPTPFLRARLQLAFGEWLRRRRRMADSRAPLRAARDAFDALGLPPWGERARQELRASGETSRRRSPNAIDELTPQELQIVQLTVTGLSNREIGQRLYLSHRTVESHLYRVFPKLGVTSRAQLSNVIGDSLAVSA